MTASVIKQEPDSEKEEDSFEPFICLDPKQWTHHIFCSMLQSSSS